MSNQPPQPFLPYPPIAAHGVIGDRRTAALVAADGTLNWLCLPNYDSASIFAVLLDAEQGGFWRIGPATPTIGRQHYHDESAVLVTTWETDTGRLELTDTLLWPETDRPKDMQGRRVLLRRLRCTEGIAAGGFDLMPRLDFDHAARILPTQGGYTIHLAQHALGLWTTANLNAEDDRLTARLNLHAGETVWAVLLWEEAPATWTVERAQTALDTTVAYWHSWAKKLTYTGPRKPQILRSAQTVHLLSFAPTGSLVAAPTTSLPERIGGNLNYDYRFAWVRDASLSMAILAMLGDTQAPRPTWTGWHNSIRRPMRRYRSPTGSTATPT
ncbi:MAG: hypothetical protein HC828_02635 [Blastochloris sp.]|nr:hypothetical protein [Blastochloris sp.]